MTVDVNGGGVICDGGRNEWTVTGVLNTGALMTRLRPLGRLLVDIPRKGSGPSCNLKWPQGPRGQIVAACELRELRQSGVLVLDMHLGRVQCNWAQVVAKGISQ
jgi:hypothetical protein